MPATDPDPELLRSMERFRALFPEVRALIAAHAPPGFPEMGRALAHIIDRPLPPFTLLPLCSAEACGGDPQEAIPVAASWLVLNLGMRLLDDAQDQDRPGGYWAELGVPRATNLAGALAVLAFQILERNHWPERRARRVRATFGEELLHIAAGQDSDLRMGPSTLADCWRTLEDKNGRIFALGCAGGAIAAGAAEPLVDAIRTYGYLWAPPGRGLADLR
ncbi:MAG: polyprenyl synthetase family protein [Myxococcota bacterium]|nr:polyprenyl synthetase family protein [Myxococcota bacterium]